MFLKIFCKLKFILGTRLPGYTTISRSGTMCQTVWTSTDAPSAFHQKCVMKTYSSQIPEPIIPTRGILWTANLLSQQADPSQPQSAGVPHLPEARRTASNPCEEVHQRDKLVTDIRGFRSDTPVVLWPESHHSQPDPGLSLPGGQEEGGEGSRSALLGTGTTCQCHCKWRTWSYKQFSYLLYLFSLNLMKEQFQELALFPCHMQPSQSLHRRYSENNRPQKVENNQGTTILRQIHNCCMQALVLGIRLWMIQT